MVPVPLPDPELVEPPAEEPKLLPPVLEVEEGAAPNEPALLNPPLTSATAKAEKRSISRAIFIFNITDLIPN